MFCNISYLFLAIGDRALLIEHHKILMKIASVITCLEELDILGIWLGCDPNDVTRLRNTNLSIKESRLSDSLFLLQLGTKQGEVGYSDRCSERVK